MVTGTATLRAQVVAVAFEHGCGPEPDAEIEVAGGAAVGAGFPFAGGADPRAVLDAGGDPHVDAAGVAALLDRDAAGRAVERFFERELDLVLDVAPLLRPRRRGRGRARLRAVRRRDRRQRRS